MYCSKTQTPNVQASPSDLPRKADTTSSDGNVARKLTQVTAVAGLWSSRRVRAVILTEQAARPQPR